MYRTVIFSVNLYRRKTWSAALIEKNVLRVIEDGALREISGAQEEVTGYWRKLYNERSCMICTPHCIPLG